MANRLSDEELRRRLQEYGQDVGPITSTTRSIWEKKLLSLRKANGPSPPSRALNAFSSDDSEIESPVNSKPRKKRTSFSRSEIGESHERSHIGRSPGTISKIDSETFKKPSPVYIPYSGQEKKDKPYIIRPQLLRNQNNKVKRRSSGKNSTFDVETSDSDFDSDGSMINSKSHRIRKKSPTAISDAQSVNFARLNANILNYENSLKKKSLNSSLSTDSEQSIRFSPTLERLKRDNLDQSYRTNGYLTNSRSNGEFHVEKVRGSSTNYSHCISWMLLIGVVAFFVIIGALYMTEVQKSSQSTSKTYLKFCEGIREEQCKLLILVSRELHELLTTTAGQYECDSKGLIKSRNMTVAVAKSILWKKLSSSDYFTEHEFYAIFRHSVYLIMKNPEWGIKWSSESDELSGDTAIKKPTSLPDSSALEAVVAAKSLWCRIRLSLQWTASTIFTLCIGAFLLFLLYCGGKLWKKRREVQEKMFYEMVEKVIDILQDQQDSSYQSDSSLGPYKAVVNIRDTLISPKERKTKLWLWDKVVAFIEENESRVSVEYKTIAGEDFKVWRWNPSTNQENEGGKQGKVWQGQAFNSLGKGKNATYSPTPCLKIRNMFDPEVEYGDEWQVSIQDAILEKCEGNDGIHHIAFDTSSNEGCVYMLCSSSEAAGKAFNALHGWWFDNKLVTVKYIRYERYLERFPEAEHCTEPLKPSNNKRLSLSTPFFSSALERS
ncbi:inner nuclear membrane protein Man1-like isoform X2 [Uloborus diversus]|uniref:inner nuclear membrane protein Man1-like isoform X2 n=1 Tax=Uloborus diversus TaxID=327109 RepID=UPI002409099A|nr:inner nuclear membrane protein Man1-like isoform X2 [Uloborus diversus]